MSRQVDLGSSLEIPHVGVVPQAEVTGRALVVLAGVYGFTDQERAAICLSAYDAHTREEQRQYLEGTPGSPYIEPIPLKQRSYTLGSDEVPMIRSKIDLLIQSHEEKGRATRLFKGLVTFSRATVADTATARIRSSGLKELRNQLD